MDQWYRNKTKGKGRRDAPEVDPSAKSLSARTLLLQHNKALVNDRVTAIREEDAQISHLQAWNSAATEIVQQIKSDQPEEFERFKALAAEMRSATSADYTERSPEVIKRRAYLLPSRRDANVWCRMLTKMPKTLVNQINEWSRTTGAVFYMMALYELPGQPGLQTVE